LWIENCEQIVVNALRAVACVFAIAELVEHFGHVAESRNDLCVLSFESRDAFPKLGERQRFGLR